MTDDEMYWLVNTSDIKARLNKLGIKAHAVNEASDTMSFCSVLYGSAGSGKTPLACMLAESPYGGPLALIDAEGGFKSVNHLPNVDRIPITEFSDIDKIYKEFLIDCPYRSVVLDNLSEILNRDINDIAESLPGNQANDGRAPYIRATNDVTVMIRKWRDLSELRNINVVFVAWDTTIKNEVDGSLRHKVQFNPKLAEKIPGMVDVVGYLTPENDLAGTRKLSFSASKFTDAKFRRSPVSVWASIPNEIYFTLGQNPMVDILATIRGGEPFPEGKYTKQGAKFKT